MGLRGRDRSVQWHLIALTLAVLVPALVFAAIGLVRTANEQVALVDQGLVSTSHALALAVDREVARSIAALQLLATSRSLDAEGLATFRQEALRARDSQEGWWTTSPTSRTCAPSSTPDARRSRASTRPGARDG
jgi:hypothetical protein